MNGPEDKFVRKIMKDLTALPLQDTTKYCKKQGMDGWGWNTNEEWNYSTWIASQYEHCAAWLGRKTGVRGTGSCEGLYEVAVRKTKSVQIWSNLCIRRTGYDHNYEPRTEFWKSPSITWTKDGELTSSLIISWTTSLVAEVAVIHGKYSLDT